jgi:hypothetical protein
MFLTQTNDSTLGYNLWMFMVNELYTHTHTTSIDEWIQIHVKNVHNNSIIWKVFLLSFSLIGNLFARFVGRGKSVQIGVTIIDNNKKVVFILLFSLV